ncbi:MAG: oligosaccharide flippase family protein [Cytophagales bacterium]|jgi:O-antigen/teichoic acid export membrane protein|nr:oligosaccharide flippase family protein [Cytophagales bacterium]
MQFFSSEDKSLFFSNFINLFFVKLLSKFAPLIITGYVISVLGMFEYGKISFAKAVAFYFTTLISYGFDYTGAQQVIQANAERSRTKINYVISNIFAAQIISIVFLIFFYFGLVDFFPKITEIKLELLYFLGVAIASALFPIYIFHGINQIWIVSLLSFLSKVVLCILVPFFVKTPDDKLNFILIHASVDFVRLIISYIILFFNFRIRIQIHNVCEIIEQFRNGFSFFIYQCYLLFGSKFSIVFLGFILNDPILVGIFSLCNHLFGFIKEIYNAAIQALYPIVSIKFSSHKNIANFVFHYLLIILPVVLIISLLTYISAPFILNFFTTEQLSLNIQLFKILIIIFPVIAVNEFLGTNILIPMRKSAIFVVMMLICIGLSIIFHFYFVSTFGIFGGAYAIFAQEVSLLVLQIAFLLFYSFF